MNHLPKLIAASLALACTAFMGCAGEVPEKLIASAKTYLAGNDPKAAIIQLKNALQSNPDLPEARFLLGKALLDSADAVSAAVEFRKAIELEHPDTIVIPALAKSLIAQGQHQELVDQYSATELLEPTAAADLKTSVAISYSMLGKSPQANLALDAALQKTPEYVPSLIAKARFMADEKDFEAALDLIRKILLKAPENHEAWQLKGALLFEYKNDAPGAVAAYREALRFSPHDLVSHFGISLISLHQKDIDSAAAQVDELVKVWPGHPRTKYLQAQLAAHRGDYIAAKELLQKILSATPNDPGALHLAGAVAFELRSFSQAEKLLRKTLQISPELRQAQWLLAQTYLQSGRSARALTLIHPVLDTGKLEARWLVLAAEAYAQGGNRDKADEYYERAAKLDPEDTKSRTALALSQLSKGNVDKAFDALQAIASSDSATYADLALINVHLRRKEFDDANKAIDNLERKRPNEPSAAYLRGKVRIAQKQVSGARQSFGRALEINPAYFPAAASLAKLDLADSQPELAKSRFEGVLDASPRNIPALLAMAKLREQAGGSVSEVAELIAKAVELNPDEASPRLKLIGYYLKSKDTEAALVSAQAAVAALPQNLEVLTALARAQMASGDLNQAIRSYTELARMQPQSPRAHLGLAQAYRARKDNDSEIKSLRRALEIAPKLVIAQRALIAAELTAKRPEKALAVARTVQTQRPDEAVGFVLEGKVELLRKNFDLAATAFRAGLEKKKPTSELPRGLHSALTAAKKHSVADAFATKWVKNHPDDHDFLAYLGDLAFSRGSYLLAEASYLDVLRRDPDRVAVLNNLASVLTSLKKPGAVGYAQKAHDLQPDNPQLLAALGRAQMLAGDFDQAIGAYTKLTELQPQSPNAHLGLANVYLAHKDVGSAIKSLKRALEISPDRLEVQQALVSAELAAQQPEEALATARTVQQQRPDESVGFLLEGRVEASQRNWDAALTALRIGLTKKNAASELAHELHTTLIAAQKSSEADDFAEQWLKGHSNDDKFLLYLGGIALTHGNYKLAETRYLDVLRHKPGHVAALNNLAFVQTALKKPSAVDYAKKANDLRPNQPALMDTLAMALAQNDMLDKAIEVQQKALELQPENHVLRLNLARIYVQAGEKSLARSALDRLSKLGDKFSKQATVKELLSAL